MLARKILLHTSVMVLLGAASFAQAESSYYVKVSLGNANVDVAQENLADFEDDDKSYGLTLGIKHTAYFSTELTMFDYGEAINSYSLFNGKIEEEIETIAFSASALATFPINDTVLLYGKFGLTRWENEFTYSLSQPGNSGKIKDKEKGMVPHWGAGAAVEITENLTATVDYHNFDMESNYFSGDLSTEIEMDLSSWSLGLTLSF